MAASNIGNDFKIQIGDGLSPESFADFCAAFEVGELGEEKSLIDITTLCSDTREYRNGLADGLEIPLTVNFVQGDDQVRGLYNDYKADALRTFRIVTKDSPQDTWEFSAIVRSWKLGISVGERSSVEFGLKVSGPVTWVEGA